MKTQTKNNVIEIYNKRAKRYDTSTSLLYNFLGLKIKKHREAAVTALNLTDGNTVVEIGCGTGENFSLLQKHVGSRGKIIGIDLTESMLNVARTKLEKNNWNNVELVSIDGAGFRFPQKVDGILSTFALTMMPEFEQIIINSSYALGNDKKLVVMDFKLPTSFLSKFPKTLILLIRPYGGTLEMADRHPWEVMQKHFGKFKMNSFWFDMAYIAEANN